MDESLYRIIDITIKVLTVLFGSGLVIALLRFVASLVQRWWRGRLRVEIKTFDVITDPATLLPKLYGEENNPDILAHHRIPYQRRDPARDIQAELRAALNETRYLLIIARTGIGKTREAAMLAASLMNEGWRVVHVKKTGWLDVPKEFPSELKNDRRRVLILLDDLNGLFRTGSFMQSPKATEMPMLAQPSYHDRLFGFLDAFEKMCGESEIRVIATARDETDEWKVLDYDPRDALWKRFKRVELPEPHPDGVVELLEESVARANIKAERNDFPTIARENDGTFANVVLNLQRVQKENRPLTRDNYTATLNGSWREVYERAYRKHPAVQYIYNAIRLLKAGNVPLTPARISSIAFFLWWGNLLECIIRQVQTERALHYVVYDGKIFAQSGGLIVPRDGQVEAGPPLSDGTYTFPLGWHFVLFSQRYFEFLEAMGIAIYNDRNFQGATNLFKAMTKLYPLKESPNLHLGRALSELGLVSEAEHQYRLALKLNPSYALAYYNLALLYEKTNRLEDSKKAYEKLSELNPGDYNPLIALASIHKKLGDSGAHENCCQKAEQLIGFEDTYNLARLKSVQQKTSQALDHLQQAIQQAEFDRVWIWKDPAFDSIRSDPRFREIVGPPPESVK